jgi:alpha-1,3-glucosyltransferase
MSASPSMGMGHGGTSLAAILAEANGNIKRTTSTNVQREAADVIVRQDASLSPLRVWAKSLLVEGKASSKDGPGGSSMFTTIACAVLISTLVKWLTGLSGWSGRGQGPMFGDFEAQRHWIELTLHLPASKWYFYDLQYWGLDYPPLTALVSRWCGLAGVGMFPGLIQHFELDKSRGTEAPELILFMRFTVIVLDLLVYTPALLFFLNRKLHGRGRRTRAVASLSALLQPSLILIDFGHFQYNVVMLGLATIAFGLLYTSLPNPDARDKAFDGGKAREDNRLKSLSRRISYEYIAAAVFFSLSLSFKQMALYYAPAVFAIMLGRCVGLARIGFERGLICFFGIALATSLTFFFTFRRWLTAFDQIAQVIHRIFPVARGLFEDKVANVWCFLSVLPLPARYKLKNALSVKALTRLSLASTLLAILLPCLHLFAAAAETVHIEMFLGEESRRQVLASEKRKAEGSVVGGSSVTGRRPRQVSMMSVAPSDAGSEMQSVTIAQSVRSSVFPAAQDNVDARASKPTSSGLAQRTMASSSPSPAASVLPYALLSTSMAFFLFGFQTHEKTILLPLLPMTLLMSVKNDEWGGGAGKVDWEWAVLMNNVAVFSMWPLLKRDGLALQYVLLTCSWNWAIGYRPFAGLTTQRKTFVAWSAAAIHVGILALHAAEVGSQHMPALVAPILRRYPDLFAVLNVLLSTPVFVLIWLWSSKRQIEVGFASGIDLFKSQERAKRQKRRTDRASDSKTK